MTSKKRAYFSGIIILPVSPMCPPFWENLHFNISNISNSIARMQSGTIGRIQKKQFFSEADKCFYKRHIT